MEEWKLKKLGKKNNSNLDTIEAFNCSDLYVCGCTGDEYTIQQYYSKNDNLYKIVRKHN